MIKHTHRASHACQELQKLLPALKAPPCNQKPFQETTVSLGPHSSRHRKVYLISFISCLACVVQTKGWVASQGSWLLSCCSGLWNPSLGVGRQSPTSSFSLHRGGAVTGHPALRALLAQCLFMYASTFWEEAWPPKRGF